MITGLLVEAFIGDPRGPMQSLITTALIKVFYELCNGRLLCSPAERVWCKNEISDVSPNCLAAADPPTKRMNKIIESTYKIK
jgi:hypothetical protein